MTELKIRHPFNNQVETVDVNIIYTAKHVNDRRFYDSLDDVEFLDDTEILLIAEERSQYGYSVLYLKDKVNKIYEYYGFGDSAASSIVSYMLKDIEHRKNSINKRLEDLEERIKNHASEIEDVEKQILNEDK